MITSTCIEEQLSKSKLKSNAFCWFLFPKPWVGWFPRQEYLNMRKLRLIQYTVPCLPYFNLTQLKEQAQPLPNINESFFGSSCDLFILFILVSPIENESHWSLNQFNHTMKRIIQVLWPDLPEVNQAISWQKIECVTRCNLEQRTRTVPNIYYYGPLLSSDEITGDLFRGLLKPKTVIEDYYITLFPRVSLIKFEEWRIRRFGTW